MIILHPQQDNKLAVTVPCISLELAIASLPTNTYKVVETLDINNDFFDAYEFDQDKGAVINIEKAKDLINFDPKIKLEEGLKKTIKYFEKVI